MTTLFTVLFLIGGFAIGVIIGAGAIAMISKSGIRLPW